MGMMLDMPQFAGNFRLVHWGAPPRNSWFLIIFIHFKNIPKGSRILKHVPNMDDIVKPIVTHLKTPPLYLFVGSIVLSHTFGYPQNLLWEFKPSPQ